MFPESIICSGGSFSIKPSNGGSVFTATLSFRFGGLVSMHAKKRAAAIRLHMKEEGKNLKALLEGKGKKCYLRELFIKRKHNCHRFCHKVFSNPFSVCILLSPNLFY